MVNSSALFAFAGVLAFVWAFGPEPSQPANDSVIADRAAAAARCRQWCIRTLMEDSLCPPLPSAVLRLSYKRLEPGDRKAEWNGNCARRRESPTDSPRPACKRIR